LVEYADGEKRYIIAPQGLTVGMTIISGSKAAPEVGNSLFLKDIPLGTVIHNIEMKPGKGAIIARSAGSFAQLTSRDGKYAVITMPSGENRLILSECIASIGAVSNAEHSLVRSGKAGRSRWLGRRPRVRGVAMNPVDHPMGGGEGRQSGGIPRTRKGTPSRGYKTRKPKNQSNRFILERRKK
jgi:large subunit ribosomal protein L2